MRLGPLCLRLGSLIVRSLCVCYAFLPLYLDPNRFGLALFERGLRRITRSGKQELFLGKEYAFYFG